MKTQTVLLIFGAALFLALGVYLTYMLNKPTPATKPDHGTNHAGSNAAGHTVPDTPSPEPADPSSQTAMLITEQDLGNLPPYWQELLANPFWNQPYLTPPAWANDPENAPEPGEIGGMPYMIAIKVDAPLDEKKEHYILTATTDESGSFAEVALRLEIVPSTPVNLRLPRYCAWAFRDGTLQLGETDGSTRFLSACHRYELQPGQDSVFVIRCLLQDIEDRILFADSLPIEISAP